MNRISGARSLLATAVVCLLLLAGCDWFTSVDDRLGRAAQLASTGDDRAAVIELKNALKSEPDNARARLMLAALTLHMGDAKLADQELKRAMAAGADGIQAAELAADIQLALGRFTQLSDELGSATAKLQEPQLSIYRGLAAYGQGQMEVAEACFRSALQIDSQADRARVGLAEVLLQQGRSEEASQEADRALQMNPAGVRAHLVKGNILARRGEYSAAAKELESARDGSAAELNVLEQYSLLLALAEAQLGAGDIAAARQTQKEVEARTGASPLSGLVAARIAMAEQNYPAAITESQKVLAAAPQLLKVKLVLGAALLANGNLNQAEIQLADLVRQAPENLEARKLLAQVNLRLQRPDVAMQVLSPVQADAADPQVSALLGWASLQRGDQSAGEELLERSVAAQPQNDKLKLDLALAYLSGGQPQKAIDLLKTVPAGQGDARRESLMIAAVGASRGSQAAKDEVDRMVAEHPQDVSILNIAAAFCIQQHDYDRARQHLGAALRSDSRSTVTLLAQGRVELLTGNVAGAKKALNAVLEIDPKNSTAVLWLAQLAARDGDTETARVQLEGLRKADPGAVVPRLWLGALYLHEKKVREADEVLREARNVPDSGASVPASIGKLYLAAGRYDEALNHFREAAQKDKTNPAYLLNIARAQLALGNPNAARESARSAITLQPDSIEAGSILIGLAIKDGNRTAAVDQLASLKKAHPTDPAVALLEGDSMMQLREPEAAAHAYASAYRMKPSSLAAARSLSARQAAKLPTPEALVEEWLKREPADAAARMVLADFRMTTGDVKAAIAHYEKIVSDSRPNAMALNNLAWLYFEAGDVRAEATARRAYEQAPGIAAIADTYGWILVKSGKAAAVLPILREAAEAPDALPEIRYHYAAALAGSDSEASRTILRALLASRQAFPGSEDAQKLLADLGG